MKVLYIIGIISIVISITLGIFLFLNFEKLDEEITGIFLMKNMFSSFVTFSIITFGGIIVKSTIDQTNENERNKRVKEQREEELKINLISEITKIYSGFYEIRKLYHSVLDECNFPYSKLENEKFKSYQKMLEKCVGLEGSYGALKVKVIFHYGLEPGDWRSKKGCNLEETLEKENDVKKKMRIRLDLIGEYLDDWRNAIEMGVKIEDKIIITNHYTEALSFIRKEKIL